jgi:hypothetical protein
LHFRLFLNRVVHLPVPSEDVSRRGKKIFRIFAADLWHDLADGPGAERFSEVSKMDSG